MTEQVTLLEAKKDGEILVLLDGRRLYVNPGDIPTVCTWLPTTGLEITEGESDRMFSVTVRNTTNGEEIRARWV